MLAAVVFALASLTDFVDGYLARARDSVTSFGKLMDPLADKLLVVAALSRSSRCTVSTAWVAMVIIARELAVTMLRIGASHSGVVIGASRAGQAEDGGADRDGARDDRGARAPAVALALIYAMVAVTVVSGLDYFFGLRRHMHAASKAVERRARRATAHVVGRPAHSTASRARLRTGQALGAPAREPFSHSSIVVWCGARSPERTSERSSLSSPWRSATTLCWWIVSRFSWRAHTKLAPSSSGKPSTTPAIISLTQSSTNRGTTVRLLDDLDLVGALHELVDLGGHRALDDREQRGRVELGVALLDAPDLQRAKAALVVRRDGHALEDALDLGVREAVSREPRGRA